MLTKKKQAAVGLCLVGASLFLFVGCIRSGPAALLEGKRKLDLGEPVSAVRELREAVSLMPTNPMAWGYLGLAYQQAGSASNAVEAYHHALALKPNLAEIQFNLGCLWMQQEQWGRARENLATAVGLRKNSAIAWQQLGEVEVRLGQDDAAVRSLERAVRLDQKSANAWNWLGVAQLRQGRIPEAANSFQAALRLQANHGPALLNLAILTHQKLNDPQKALQLYRQYLAFLPNASNAVEVRRLADHLEVAQRSGPKSDTVASKERQAPRRTTPTAPEPLPAHTTVPASGPAVVAGSAQPEPPPGQTVIQMRPPVESASAPLNVESRPIATDSGSRSGVSRTAEPKVEISAREKPSPSTELPVNEPQAVAEESPKKRGFFSKINPLNLLKGKTREDQPVPPASSADQSGSSTRTNAP